MFFLSIDVKLDSHDDERLQLLDSLGVVPVSSAEIPTSHKTVIKRCR